MKFLFTAMLLAFAIVFYGQDLIILKTGEEIPAVIKQVTTDNVSYTNYGSTNSVTFTIGLSDVFMLKYADGRKQVASELQQQKPVAPPATPQAITPAQAQSPSKSVIVQETPKQPTYKINDDAYTQYKKKRATGIGLLVPGVILTAASFPLSAMGGLFIGTGDDGFAYGMLSSGVISLVAGLPMFIVGGIKLKQAKQLKKSSQVNAMLNVNPFYHSNTKAVGTSLTLTF